VWNSLTARALFRLDAASVCPERGRRQLHISEEQKKSKVGHYVKRTYQCRWKDKLVEHTARQCQSVLEGVACRGLLVLLGILTCLEGSRPRDVSKVEDPGVTILGILRLGRTRTLPSLLYLRGGGPHCALGASCS
jgi:hypothetical protein